ncbi:MAG TPA: hypothetical protein VFV96_13995 [Verrucomicrobiae bacterium]|jgi:hypothetical protein|nr:hypothetical protein [Verrucomicrobiae bacterium]
MKPVQVLLFCLAVGTLSGCVSGGAPQKNSLELQAFQRKEFSTSKKVAFAATVSVFQDLGYIIKAADFQTGLITASSPTKNVAFFGMHMSNTEATAFVEEFGADRTFIRLNFVEQREDSSGYGMKSKSDKPIIDPKIYEACFQKIQEAVFIRTNTQ